MRGDFPVAVDVVIMFTDGNAVSVDGIDAMFDWDETRAVIRPKRPTFLYKHRRRKARLIEDAFILCRGERIGDILVAKRVLNKGDVLRWC